MAKAAGPEKVSFRARLRQIGMVFSFTAKRDKLFIPLVAVAVLLPLLAGTLMVTFGGTWIWLPVGLMAALAAAMGVLSVRSNKAMMKEAENQPGAAASIIENMRGDWRVTPGLASTTQLDFVHLIIGKPGVILLGEGNPGRVRGLLGQEKRRLSKVIGSAELRDFIVGHDEGQVPMAKLRVTLMKLPRTLTGKEVNALDLRLKALSARPQMPKGAIPKNMRPPKSRPDQPEPAAVGHRHAPDPDHPHARGLPEQADEEAVLGDQHHWRGPGVAPRIGEQAGREQAQHPVDEQAAEATPQARGRAGGCRIRRRGRTLCHGYRA